jgi:protein-L-isoaspartate O-methyltransferase
MHVIAMDKLKPFLKDSSTFLDVGCGTGYSTLCISMLSDRLKMPLHCHGIDIYESLTEQATLNAKKYSQNVQFKTTDFFEQDINFKPDLAAFGFGVPFELLNSRVD